MTKLHDLNNLGQAIWLDFIRRAFIDSGDLKVLVEQGLRGVTSNPSIFEKAIAGSDDYDADLRQLAEAGKSVDEIYEALAISDIQRATDILRPVYDESSGADGFVSLEVNPNLAHKTEETIAEAKRLAAAVNRPNLMIKVPATPEGIPAIKTLIGEGYNINVTLIFSVAQYEDVVEAYIAGLEHLAASGGDLNSAASVASFFVSRVDGKVDAALDEKGVTDLKGKIAIANSKLAYERFKVLFAGERWEKLAAAGARVQRPLWASTSTKNPAYSDTLYVDTLIGPHTVNTLPPKTLDAFRDHGTVAVTIEDDMEQVHADLARLVEVGIDLDAITDNLLAEGVDKFAQAFNALMDSIKTKQKQYQVTA